VRYIKKQETPPAFTDWKAQANEDWQPYWNSKATNFRNPQKEIVHQSLLKEQGYICCYCQRRINLNNSHIEHFKPKDENCYPELSLEYSNFLASCQKEKEDKPKNYQESPVHCGHLKGNWYDENLMISPLQEDCNEYFIYTAFGDILSTEDDHKKESAKITIEKLGLNIPKLKSERRAVIEGLQELLQQVGNSKETLEILIKNYDQVNKEGYLNEFCEVLIHFLKQYI
jgi:uncharacterized protein (TIGR02646 family)